MARLIDSEVAYRFLTDQLLKVTGKYSEGVNKGLNIARSAMRNPDAIPTIDPESLRPRGRWERMLDPYGKLEGFIHVECGFYGPCAHKYCPYCGAKMED